MSAAPKAVFLSYASQDADAARNICDALRAAGVEVWFDQSELRGGDAWDQKLRRQIKECALFVPVISTATQARLEGYFRLEWKLAAQRTHTMADAKPFLLPVVIDATRDSDAHVPEEFRAVQWTRLPLRRAQGRPDGEPTPQFVERVRTLLGSEVARAIQRVEKDSGTDSTHSKARATGSPRPVRWRWAVLAAVIVIGGTAAFLATRPTDPSSTNSKLLPSEATRTALDRRESGGPRPGTTQNPKPPDLSSDKSIAVLPFVNQSDDKENTAFFADGMHEDILTHLANIRDLRVISRTSVTEYRDTKKKIPQIAQELGVVYILEGSVRRAGNRVRITGQLIRAANDEHLWAKYYDRDLTAKDIFDIQTALAAEIAGVLRTIISPETKKLLERRPTENFEAYECYLKAQAQISEFGASRDSMGRRIVFLQQAVDLDPNFAEAWGALATSHAFFVFSDYDHTPARSQAAEAAMAHALRLAPDVPEVIRQLGVYYYGMHRDFARATEQYEKVIRLQPNNAAAINFLGLVQRRQGRWLESLANLRKASELEPRNVQHSRNLCGVLEAGRNWEAARTELRRIIALHPDNLALQFRLVVLAFSATGSTREADDWLARLTPAQRESTDGAAARRWRKMVAGALAEETQLDSRAADGQSEFTLNDALMMAASGDKAGARSRVRDMPGELRARLEREPANPMLWRQLGIAEALLGRRDEALAAARKAVALRPSARDAYLGPDFQISLAAVHAWTGDLDEALAELTRLLRVPVSGYVGFGVHALRVHPHFAPLRGDPRFEALLEDPKNNAPLF